MLAQTQGQESSRLVLLSSELPLGIHGIALAACRNPLLAPSHIITHIFLGLNRGRVEEDADVFANLHEQFELYNAAVSCMPIPLDLTKKQMISGTLSFHFVDDNKLQKAVVSVCQRPVSGRNADFVQQIVIGSSSKEVNYEVDSLIQNHRIFHQVNYTELCDPSISSLDAKRLLKGTILLHLK